MPAYCGECKLCPWYSSCLKRLNATNDLTLIPQLGRAKRDAMLSHIGSIDDLAQADVSEFRAGKKTIFPGIGPDTLEKFQARAKLITAGTDAKPYLREPVSLPHSAHSAIYTGAGAPGAT